MTVSLAEDSQPYAGYFVSLILIIVAAIVVVVLRFFVKWRFARNVGPEDWFSAAALVSYSHASRLSAFRYMANLCNRSARLL